MSYYEEDLPDVSENEVERDKTPDDPDKELIPEGMEHVKASPNESLFYGTPENLVPATVEQTDPGSNHTEMMEMLGGIFVQLSRIYDVLMMGVPAATRDMLDEMHGDGGLMASPPVLREDAWSDE